jgi:hypothetical protein
MKPLFIPLKTEFFEAFKAGTKPEEYRLYGPRWNERTCPPGRPVVLAKGYGHPRLKGVVKGFRKDKKAAQRADFKACYPKAGPDAFAACIAIEVEKAGEGK